LAPLSPSFGWVTTTTNGGGGTKFQEGKRKIKQD